MASTTTAQSGTRELPAEAARIKVIRWGGVMAAVYFVYIIFFPLTPTIWHSDHILEIEQMLREGRRWFAPLYVLGLATLFYSFWRVLKIVHRLSQEDPQAAGSLRIWVLGIGIVSGIILLGLYPITALDVALYVIRARLWALYGGSPMIALPASFPHDPYVRLAAEYIKEVSPYGPVWELIAQIPTRLGILDIAGGIVAMKTISLISYACLAILIGWYAQQDTPRYGVSGLTAMTFFVLNPLVFMEAIGNGHNDMLMLALMTLGLVLWQRERWAWAAFALTLATLIKITGLILIPLFGVAVLAAASTWRARILRGAGILLIFLVTAGIAYSMTGPFPGVFAGAGHAMFGRWGYTPTYAVLMVAEATNLGRAITASALAALTHGIFILYFAYLLVQLARGRMTLVQAGFLAYFSQLMLGTTFRIWYPMWLIPFAALGLNSNTYWRTFLFSITAELSILMYLLVWRWGLESWDWGLHGPLRQYWNFWTVTTLITVPWVFGIPLLGPLVGQRQDPTRFANSLWI